MKKKVLPFILILLCVLAFAVSYASAERGIAIVLELPEKEINTETKLLESVEIITEMKLPESVEIITEMKLPESVEIIEDEAFEGTAFVKVILSDTLTQIGERAFAGIKTLREIRIPLSTKYIASTAFEGSNRITIIAPANSYARAYAKNKGIPFSPIVMFCAVNQALSVSAITINRSAEVVDTETKADFKPDTQWRRIEELNITRTDKLIADHVQSRAPPMA